MLAAAAACVERVIGLLQILTQTPNSTCALFRLHVTVSENLSRFIS
jgi:hypothetical protein